MEGIKNEVVQNAMEADIIPFDPVNSVSENTTAATGKSLLGMIVVELIKDATIFMAGFCIAKAHSIHAQNKEARKCGECELCSRYDEYHEEDEPTEESEDE